MLELPVDEDIIEPLNPDDDIGVTTFIVEEKLWEKVTLHLVLDDTYQENRTIVLEYLEHYVMYVYISVCSVLTICSVFCTFFFISVVNVLRSYANKNKVCYCDCIENGIILSVHSIT